MVKFVRIPLVESPQQRRKRLFFDNLILIVSLVSVTIISILFVVFHADILLNLSSSRYLLSALIQSLSTILALLVTVTLIGVQIVSTRTPRAIESLPKVGISLFIVCYIVVIILDVIALNNLHISISSSLWVFLLFLNTIALFIIIPYTLMIVHWAGPGHLFRYLIKKIKKSKNSEWVCNAIFTIEEIANQSARAGHIETCRYIVDLYPALSEIIAEKYREEKEWSPKPLDHPVRVLPKSLGRIGVYFARSKVEDAIPSIIFKYESMAELYSQNNLAADVEFSMSIEGIIRECANNKLESTIYNFLANFGYVIEYLSQKKIRGVIRAHNYRSPGYMFCTSLEDIIESLKVNRLYNALHETSRVIYQITEIYKKYGCEYYAIDNMKEVIRILQETSEYLGILDFRGKYDDRTISYYIKRSKSNMEKIDESVLWK